MHDAVFLYTTWPDPETAKVFPADATPSVLALKIEAPAFNPGFLAWIARGAGSN